MSTYRHPAPQTHFDVIIHGGGIVGLTTALLLAQSGLKIAVLEQHDKPHFIDLDKQDIDCRVFAINYASQQVFEKIGIWHALSKSRHGVMQAIEVWDNQLSGQVSFNAFDAKLPYLGLILEQKMILRELYAAMSDFNNITCFHACHTQALHYTNDLAFVTTKDGFSLSAQCVIGCDGARSWTAQQAGITINQKSYNQAAIVATIQTSHAHHQSAFQRFDAHGALALLPLASPNLISIVWSLEQEYARQMYSLPIEQFNQRLRDCSDNRLGALACMSQRYHFPLVAQHAKRYYHHRTVLIGDAAHVIHPLAGQGVNLGIADANALADILTQAYFKKRDIGQPYLLARYQRKRRASNQMMLALMRVFKEGFMSQNPTIEWLRNAGFDCVNRTSMLKKFFIMSAIGQH